MIAAEGEQKASGALKAAADVISESPNALQVIQLKLNYSVFMQEMQKALKNQLQYNFF